MNHKKRDHPSEDAFLTNPIASATEATGCSLQIREENGTTKSVKAPVTGAKLPDLAKRKEK